MKNPGGTGSPVALRLCVLALLCAALPWLPVNDAFADGTSPAEQPVDFDIPVQRIADALGEFARQAGVQIFFISEGFENTRANAVVGTYSPQEALDLLLAGTGLSADYSADTGIRVSTVPEAGSGPAPGPSLFLAAGAVGLPEDDKGSPPEKQRDAAKPSSVLTTIEEIVVTGTSIRGHIPESSPLQIYDAMDLRNSGAMTVEQFVSTLPQNSNTMSELTPGNSSRVSNPYSVNSVDLRGLGVGTTLVLLNGRRMAASSIGRAVDLSFIPISLVERVEVLTDGASAIYGADAIGGVINFVLRDQQEGAETVLTYGGARSGNEQVRIDQSFGANWAAGNALLALSYFDRQSLDAADRSYSREAAPFTLIPKDRRHSVLATVSHLVPGGTRVSADLLYSIRRPESVQTQFLFGGDFSRRASDHEQTLLNLEAERALGRTVSGSVLVTYAKVDTDAEGFFDGTVLGVGPFFVQEESSNFDITGKVDGELTKSGVMFALGVGYSEQAYEEFRDFSAANGSAPSDLALERSTTYGFGELMLPLVSPERGIKLVSRLELSFAARYTDYSDFGSDVSPKVGVLWSPTRFLKIRGTFGEAFRAPFLFQKNPNGGQNALFPQASLGFPDIWTPDDSAVVLFAQGPGNPSLQAENAETMTVGFDLELSSVRVSATYFDLDYTDRIAEPDPTGGFTVLGQPQNFPDLLNLDPSLAEITALLSVTENFLNLTGIDISDPGAVHAATTVFFDNRIRNLSITELSAVDFALDLTTRTRVGDLNFGVKASKILAYEERVSPSAIPVSLVDTVLFPADLKGRAFIGLQSNSWSARMQLNYVDDYDNPFDPDHPSIGAWTTVDLNLAYEFPADAGGFTRDLRVALGIQNVLDRDPPFLPISPTTNTGILNPTGFDPANADPIGRFISLRISKGW